MREREDVVKIGCNSIRSVTRRCVLCWSFLHAFLAVLVGPAFFFHVLVLCGVLCLLIVDPLTKNLQERLRCSFSVSDCNLCQKWREKDNVPRRPVLELLWFSYLAGGGTKEEFHCQETDILAISEEGALDIDRYHGWCLAVSLQGKDGDFLPRGLFLMDACVYVAWIFPCVAL